MADAPKPSPWGARLVAEAFGTFMLVLVAGTADVFAQSRGHLVEHVARYAAPGLLVMALIYSLGECSGAHFNPAVTFGFALRGDVKWRDVVPYVAAQFVGALTAAAALFSVVQRDVVLAIPVRGPQFSAWEAFAGEIVLSTLLIFVIFGTAAQAKVVGPNAAIAVGATIALCGFFASPLSGASMNPARALAPMIVGANVDDWWLYGAAPFVGAAIAAVLTYVVHGSPTPEEKQSGKGRRAR